MFPVTGVNALGEFAEFDEGIRLTNAGDLVLDSRWESDVELSSESGLAPLDSRS
jgi:hypothetical protein